MPREDKNIFIFENAQEILGVTEYNKNKAIENEKATLYEKAFNKKQEGYKIKHGHIRMSKEIGGDRDMNNEVLEWPTDEYLDGLSQ